MGGWSLGELAIAAFRRLPPYWRERLKILIGSAGHARGPLDDWRASRLAVGAKRPLLVARHLDGTITGLGWPSLSGKRVMDFGAGYLLAEPLALTLFGAAEVAAVDHTPLLRAKPFRDYAEQADWREVMDLATVRLGRPWADAWRERLRLALATGRPDWFADLGIRYRAPYDALTECSDDATFDLIHSLSTLEHLPPDRAPAIISRLGAMTRAGGAMYHYIHLEDHRDFANPFAFLTAGSDYRSTDYDRRGNRLRAADWREMFSAVPGFEWRFHEQRKDPALLPASVAPEFAHHSPDDLRVAHLTAIGHRR